MLSCLSLSLGIMLALLRPLTSLNGWIGLSLAVVGITYLISKHSRLPYGQKLALLMLCYFALGYAYSSLRINQRLNQLIKQPMPHLLLKGYLNSPVNHFESTNQVEFTITSGQFKSQQILLSYPQELTLDSGKSYGLELRLASLPLAHNDSDFNYRRYLLTNGITGLGWLQRVIKIDSPAYALAAQINRIRCQMINYLVQVLSRSEYKGLAIALVTGYRQYIPPSQVQVFKNCGLMHLISISGLHITIVSAMALLLFKAAYRLLPLRFKSPQQLVLIWLGIGVALLYSLLAGFAIPTQRSFFTLLVMGCLLSQRRYLTPFHKLALTLAIVLLIEPFAGLTSGFWLSFSLVATIYWISRSYRASCSKLAFWLRMQLALSLISLPLCLYFFNIYPLVSIIANLWAIPLLANLLTPLILFCSLLRLSLPLQIICSYIPYLMQPLNYLADLPRYWQHPPELPELLISYLGILLLLLPRSFRSKNLLGIVLGANIFALNRAEVINYGELNYQVFVNQKIGISLLQTRRYNILVLAYTSDLLSNNSASLVEQLSRIVLPYLISHQISHLDYIIANQQITSAVLLLFKQQQITTPQILANGTFYFDGIRLTNMKQANQLAVEATTTKATSYLGSGYMPFKAHKWQNIIILLPLSDLDWLYANSSKNLVLNYPSSANRRIATISENLNLNATNIYDLTQLGSIAIEKQQVSQLQDRY